MRKKTFADLLLLPSLLLLGCTGDETAAWSGLSTDNQATFFQAYTTRISKAATYADGAFNYDSPLHTSKAHWKRAQFYHGILQYADEGEREADVTSCFFHETTTACQFYSESGEKYGDRTGDHYAYVEDNKLVSYLDDTRNYTSVASATSGEEKLAFVRTYSSVDEAKKAYRIGQAMRVGETNLYGRPVYWQYSTFNPQINYLLNIKAGYYATSTANYFSGDTSALKISFLEQTIKVKDDSNFAIVYRWTLNESKTEFFIKAIIKNDLVTSSSTNAYCPEVVGGDFIPANTAEATISYGDSLVETPPDLTGAKVTSV